MERLRVPPASRGQSRRHPAADMRGQDALATAGKMPAVRAGRVWSAFGGDGVAGRRLPATVTSRMILWVPPPSLCLGVPSADAPPNCGLGVDRKSVV